MFADSWDEHHARAPLEIIPLPHAYCYSDSTASHRLPVSLDRPFIVSDELIHPRRRIDKQQRDRPKHLIQPAGHASTGYETDRCFSEHSPTPGDSSTHKEETGAIPHDALIHVLAELKPLLRTARSADERAEQLLIFVDHLNALIDNHPSKFTAVSQNDFFSHLCNPFIDLLGQWRRRLPLSDRQSFTFHKITKLILKLVHAVSDIHQLPRWLSDAKLLDTVAECLADIASTDKLLHRTSNRDLKCFSRLIDAYIQYQQRLDGDAHSETLGKLLDPFLLCLTSKHFAHLFTSLQPDQSTMTAAHKLLLLKCPAFLTSYNGTASSFSSSIMSSQMRPSYLSLQDLASSRACPAC